MSCSKWRYTEACDGRPCPGDCDECGFDPEDIDPDDYTTTSCTDQIQAQPFRWEEFDDDL